MNRISTIQISGDFEPYLQFAVDGKALDVLLEATCPGNEILNLLPTLDSSLETKEARNIVWNRILPSNDSLVCPILMCEDDRDFFCILIVVEIEVKGDVVLWKRIGLDRSSPNTLADVGTTIEWFDNSPSFEFDKGEYEKMIDSFRTQYEKFDRDLSEIG